MVLKVIVSIVTLAAFAAGAATTKRVACGDGNFAGDAAVRSLEYNDCFEPKLISLFSAVLSFLYAMTFNKTFSKGNVVKMSTNHFA